MKVTMSSTSAWARRIVDGWGTPVMRFIARVKLRSSTASPTTRSDGSRGGTSE
jgi:hypothetical protein